MRKAYEERKTARYLQTRVQTMDTCKFAIEHCGELERLKECHSGAARMWDLLTAKQQHRVYPRRPHGPTHVSDHCYTRVHHRHQCTSPYLSLCYQSLACDDTHDLALDQDYNPSSTSYLPYLTVRRTRKARNMLSSFISRV